MIYVVVAYDRSAARVLETSEFPDDPVSAFAARLARELAYRERAEVEVVLLGAENVENLKKSHARYFDPTAISAENLKTLSDDVTRRIA